MRANRHRDTLLTISYLPYLAASSHICPVHTVLQWSEGDVWRGCAELPVGRATEFKYACVAADDGALVAWGDDAVEGGGNLVAHIVEDDSVVAGYRLLVDPPPPDLDGGVL